VCGTGLTVDSNKVTSVTGFVVVQRRTPLGALPQARWGIAPQRAGLLADLSPNEAESLIALDPINAPTSVTRVVSANSLLRGEVIWAARLNSQTPTSFISSEVYQRFEVIGRPLGKSDKEAKQPFLEVPFADLRSPRQMFVVPKSFPHSRDYLSVTSIDPEVIPLNSLLVISGGSVTTFGILSSRPFFLWAHVVSQNGVTATAYNTFPFPPLTKKQNHEIDTAADTVLRARMHFLGESLNDLYSAMPRQLLQAHKNLDTVVEGILGIPANSSDSEVAKSLYRDYKALLAA